MAAHAKGVPKHAGHLPHLRWLDTMHTTGSSSAPSSPPLPLPLPPPLPLSPPLLPPMLAPVPPTRIQVTRQKPHHQRQARQNQLPSLAITSLRQLAGSRKLRWQISQKLSVVSTAPSAFIGNTCVWASAAPA